MAYRCRTGPRSARPSEWRRWTRQLRPGSEAGCGLSGCRATRIAASWDQPCHEKVSRRAKAVIWVRQVIQATTWRPFRLCYSGSTAATRPLSTCSTARPGSPGTSGTTGRVLLPDARHCAGGEAHGDPDRLLATRGHRPALPARADGRGAQVRRIRPEGGERRCRRRSRPARRRARARADSSGARAAFAPATTSRARFSWAVRVVLSRTKRLRENAHTARHEGRTSGRATTSGRRPRPGSTAHPVADADRRGAEYRDFETSTRGPGERKRKPTMGLDDKIKNAAEEAKGKAKEAVGDATDNERLQAEGRAEKAGAHIKQAGENVKDAFK